MADQPPVPAPAPAPAPRPVIKFPVRPTSAAPALVLSRRRPGATMPPMAVSEASAEARKQIATLVSATRSPWSSGQEVSPAQASQIEKTLRELEANLEIRERQVVEAEVRLADRERDLAEAEALVVARQKLLDATRQSSTAKVGLSAEEKAALEQLKGELDRQEESLREQRAAMLEREKFLEENEAKLFEKMMAQQQLETELEQRREDLAAVEQRLRDQGALPPAAPTPPPDEFNA